MSKTPGPTADGITRALATIGEVDPQFGRLLRAHLPPVEGARTPQPDDVRDAASSALQHQANNHDGMRAVAKMILRAGGSAPRHPLECKCRACADEDFARAFCKVAGADLAMPPRQPGPPQPPTETQRLREAVERLSEVIKPRFYTSAEYAAKVTREGK